MLTWKHECSECKKDITKVWETQGAEPCYCKGCHDRLKDDVIRQQNENEAEKEEIRELKAKILDTEYKPCELCEYGTEQWKAANKELKELKEQFRKYKEFTKHTHQAISKLTSVDT